MRGEKCLALNDDTFISTAVRGDRLLKSKPCVLVVDDEVAILLLVRRALEGEGYQVATADRGRTAIATFEQQPVDLVLLDISMPDIDGYAVCRHIRSFSSVPIMFLTGKGRNEEIVEGLDVGVEDYVTKPFSLEVLLARVRAVIRRSQAIISMPTRNIFRNGNLEIDFPRRQVTKAGNEINLTPTEFNLLCELVLNAGKVLTHSYLLNKVWGTEYKDERQYLHTFVGCLRTKMGLERKGPGAIQNIASVGYRFNL